MAVSCASIVVPIVIICSVVAFSIPGVSSLPSCPRQSVFFLNNLQSQCPLSLSPPIPPLQVNGSFLDRSLNFELGNVYIAVLFYASWCPFSHSSHELFETLSSMFPQIQHLVIEKSSAMPSVFSRYGVHSLPSILILNQKLRVKYHGPKDLPSLVKFYEKTTGLQPTQYLVWDESLGSGMIEKTIMQPMHGSSVKEILNSELYLALSLMFLILRLVLLILPKVLSCVRTFWNSYVPHLNLEIFGETSQILGRVLRMIDMKRVWTKLRLLKTRNLHESARSGRAWASSLASVTLGERSWARRSS
ncbi:hypothetical protein RJ641_026534 [Dillenia turbinata]|uniref:Thioredoxin domain-containing protein n=1 Tax=Dillenia turbinata TaxID=194707 RepID=A0AAN8WGC6_9MAGN